MDRSIQYTNAMYNFDSVYNAAPNRVHQPTIYIPISHENRSSLRSSNPKFNFDLYNPTESYSESFDYPSPSSSVIIHHQPVYSSPPLPSQSILKLRQINDELCHTLAQCDITTQSQPTPPLHYQIHHYPISHETYRSRSRSRSPSEQDSSSTESEPIIKKRNARITYKAHIPRRQKSLSNIDQLLISTSDVYSHDDPMTIDLYPTRDQGFVKKIRNRPDNQSPWLADTSPIRRNSYSEASTYRTPRGPYYDEKPIEPKSRLYDGNERPRPASVKSRLRPDSAPNPLRQSAISFSNTPPVWRPSGTIKHRKFIGSHAPPLKPKPRPPEPTWNPAGVTTKTKHFRAFDPVSKSLPTKPQEPVWNPPSKNSLKKHTRYFEPTLKPELTTAPVLQKKTIKTQPKIQGADPKLKTRIAKAESKVKSAWEPTTTLQEPKPPIVPRLMKPATTTTKAKVKSVPSKPIVPVKNIVPAPPMSTDTGRSSLNDVPTKPMFQSTPRNQSINENPDDLFENESETSESKKKPEIPHPPPQIEKTPTKLPHTPVPQPDKGIKLTAKDDMENRTPSAMSEVHNNDDDEREPSPILHERKATSPKPDNRDDVSVVDDEDVNQSNENDTDADIEHNLETNRSHDNVAKDKDDIISPPTPKADKKIPPHRKEPSLPPESPDRSLLDSQVESKKPDQKLPSTLAPAPATTNAVDDFFD